MEHIVKRFWGDIRGIVVSYPVEIFSVVCYAVLAIVAQSRVDDVVESAPYCWSSLFVAYGFNRLFCGGRRGVYYLSVLVALMSAVGLFFWDVELHDSRLLIITLCAMLFAVVSRGGGGNRVFVGSAAALLRNIFFAGVAGSLIIALIYSVLLSLDMIFGLQLLRGASVWVSRMSIYVIQPVAFLYFERSSQGVDLERSSFFRLLINYILTPSVLIYSVIMYAYFAKIVLAWSLPDGVITATAITYLMLGIVTKASRQLVDGAIWSWLFRYFTLLSLPALVMLWISAYVRISNYGMTGDRGYLVLLLVISSVWCMAMLSVRLYNYLRLNVFAISVMLVYTIFGYQYFESTKVDRVESPKSIKHEYLVRDDATGFDLDISKMNHLYGDIESRLEGGVLIVERAGDVIAEIATRDIVAEMFDRAGVESADQGLTGEQRKRLRHELYYKFGDMIVVFSRLSLTGEEIRSAKIDYILK